MRLIQPKLLFFLMPLLLTSQTPVDINSGNPAFPFPQFSAYEFNGNHKLDNLANKNPDGLTHAEMEKRIREAWHIMSNRFVYDGEGHAGVQYIQSNIGCPYDCSEGAGYAMIGAAYMADKTTFDGIWFREHDIRLVKKPRYSDGVVPRPNYQYGENTLAEPGGDAATDGDVDIALGLLMAWKQWGDDSGYTDFNGNVISYREEALNVIRGLVELTNRGLGDCRRVTGNVGMDGYFKNGNTWGELTNWATGQDPCPEFAGPQQLHVDYIAPAYCKAFADFLEIEGEPEDLAWNVPQLRRAEVSSDWFMGELLNQGPNTIPVAGWVSLDGANNATFSNFNEGEDFRYAWRTILNHTWHGNPENSWNPNTHQIVPGGNSFNKDMGERFSEFLGDPSIAGNPCVNPGGGLGMTFNGPSQVVQLYDPNTGVGTGAFPLNWLIGTGTPSSVSAQDFDLMGKLYRQSAIEWDQTSGQNMDSNPFYFHGFFRLLGMLVTTGNFHSPAAITPKANIKVYNSVNKTFAFTGDEVTYTLSYRNYGSVAAQNTVIIDQVPDGLEFVSATGGGVQAGGILRWNIGTVPGYNSAGGIPPTIGEVTVTFKVMENFSGRICNPVTIETSTGDGWTSNEFPNNDTAVMERNCVDIIETALEIEKTVDYTEVNPGDIVTYEVEFKNTSEGDYINGGRSGVNFAYARDDSPANGDTQGIKMRLYHGADEPYIDYKNYRLSLFLNDNTYNCIAGDPGCNIGWSLRNVIYEGGDPTGVQVSQEPIVPGTDANGVWNQRVVVQFAEQLCAPTPHLLRYFGTPRVHEGGDEPLRGVWDLFTSNFGSIDWSDDWSWNGDATDTDNGFYYPITNDWTDYYNPDIPVDRYHNEACETPTKTINNVLIEEWDGYTWRRIFGSGPVPGRDVQNVVVTDVLPLGFTFVEFVEPYPLGITPTTSVLPNGQTEIRWESPTLQIGQGGIIKYKVRADFSSGECDREDEIQTNLAAIEATNESPIETSVDVIVTCNPVILPPAPSSMTKVAMPTAGEVGDTIVYTLEYENTDGSPIEVDLNDNADWTAQNGILMPIVGGELNSVPNNDGVSTYNFSHGTNGVLEASIAFQPSAAFGFTFRHTGGNKNNGLYIVFKPNPGAGSIETKVYDGATEIDATVLGFPGDPTDIKLLLSGDQLNVWVGDTASPNPSWSVTGLPVRAGNAGFINGFLDGGDSYGLHRVTRFKSSLDSAFNVQITDPVPTEVTFVSATDGGINTADVIAYPIIPGPLLANETISYSWMAVIDSCPTDTATIVNLAYTNIMGVPENSIAAQALVNCSGEDVCAIPVALPITTNAIFCQDAVVDAIEDYITATETIVWYADEVSTVVIPTPIIDTSIASVTTYYVSQITVDGCESDREAITISVLELEVPATVDAQFCPDTVADAIEDYVTATETLVWYADAVSVDPIPTPVIDTSVASVITYYISQVNGEGCESARETITVSILELEAPVTVDAQFCPDTDADAIEDYVTATETLVWYSDELSTAPIPIPVIDTSIASVTTYYVSQINAEDCESAREAITVSILELEAPVTTDAQFCQNAVGAAIEDYVEATETLVWYVDDVVDLPIPTPEIDTSVASIITYYVSQINAEGCESEREAITVSVIELEPPVTIDVEFCADAVADEIENYVDATETLVWYSDANNTIPIPTPIINTGVASVATYFVGQINTEGCESNREAITVSVLELEAPVTTDVELCMDAVANTIESYVNANDTLVWYADAAGTAPITTPIIDTSIASITTYYVSQINAEGCESAREPITVTVNDIAIGATNTITITSNDNVNYDITTGFGLAPGTFTWEATNNANVTGETLTVSNSDSILDVLINTSTGPQTVIYSITSANNNDVCGGLFQLQVVVIPTCLELPQMPETAPAEFCLNTAPDALDNYVEAINPVIWYDTATSPTPIAMPVIDTSIIMNRSYYVSQITSEGCESEREGIQVSVSAPLIGGTDSITINSGDSVLYNITTGFGLAPGSFFWEAADNVSVTGETLATSGETVIPDVLINNTAVQQTVIYTIYGSGGSLCGTVYELEVIIIPLVILENPVTIIGDAVEEGDDIIVTVAIENPSIIETTFTIGFTEITVTDGEDIVLNPIQVTIAPGETSITFNMPTIDDEIFEPTETFTIYVISLDSGNVTDISTTAIGTIYDNDQDIVDVIEVEIPKFITPNNDGSHDYWQLGASLQEKVKLVSIYDRYGKLLTQLNRSKTKWDGRHKGYLLPSSDYWYSIQLLDGSEYNGHFSLKR